MRDDQEHFRLTDPASPKCILIVGDEDTDAPLLMRMLSQETPYHVFLATNELAALKFTRHIKPNLFLLACRLPDKNCMILYNHLHAQRGLEAVPAIFMSTSLEDVGDDIEKRQRLTFGKPLDPEDFLSTLEEVLSR